MRIDILDTCANKDCKSCCSKNANKRTGILLDFEVHTAKRFWGDDYKAKGGKGEREVLYRWISKDGWGNEEESAEEDADESGTSSAGAGAGSINVRKHQLNNQFWKFTEGPNDVEAKGDVLRIKIKKNKVKSVSGGKFKANLAGLFPSSYVKLSYDVKFGDNFKWVKGGKLPGVCFAKEKTQCAAGSNWLDDVGSFRLMWREDGQAIGYAYFAFDNANKAFQKQGPALKSASDGVKPSGLQLWFKKSKNNDALWFKRNQWNNVVIELKMNEVGKQDGLIAVTVNGKTKDVNDAVFRKDKNVQFNLLNFVSFFGGSKQEWASPVDTHVDFRNIRIETRL
jgi:hypothetical protein